MRRLIFALGLASATLTGQAMAEQLQVPISQQGDASLQIPTTGQSLSSVLQRYGEPVKRHQAVGKPPITRWEYNDFTVYFEYQTVINSVRHHQKPNVQPDGSVDETY